MDIRLPDGRVLRGVPDGTTKAQLAQKLQANGVQVPQEWFGTPAPQTGAPTLNNLGGGLVGAGETVLHALTGAAGGLGGGLNFLGTLAATGGDIEAAKAVQEDTQAALTYQPRSQTGQGMAKDLGKVMALPGKAGVAMADPLNAKLLSMGASPEVAGGAAALVATAPDALLQSFGVAGMKKFRDVAAERSAAAEVQRAAQAAQPAITPVQVARALNLKINPSDVPGAKIGGLLEGGSGSAKLKTRLSQENAPTITSHAREELGMQPGPKLTIDELEAAQQPHNAKYQAVADTLKTIEPDAAFNRALNDAGAKFKAIIQLPGIAKLKNQFANLGTLDAAQVMKQIAILRESGFNDLTTAAIKTTPNRTTLKAKGSAQVDIANAFEQLIDRNASAKGYENLIPELQNARVSLAKINSVKRALIGDDVSAASLAKQLRNGAPLSGRLKAIAEVARAHPDVMRDISKVKNKSPIGVLDVAAPATLAAATGQPAVLAGVLARPAARSIVASERYQNTLGHPAAPGQLQAKIPQYFQTRAPRAAQPSQVVPSSLPANVTPINKHKVTVKADPESGEVIVRSPNGETIAQENRGYLQAKHSNTDIAAQGSGEGVQRYLKLIDEAESRGLKLGSDISVSPAAAKLYAKLGKETGVTVKVNPHTINPTTKNLVSRDIRIPVFEVTRKAASR